MAVRTGAAGTQAPSKRLCRRCPTSQIHVVCNWGMQWSQGDQLPQGSLVSPNEHRLGARWSTLETFSSMTSRDRFRHRRCPIARSSYWATLMSYSHYLASFSLTTYFTYPPKARYVGTHNSILTADSQIYKTHWPCTHEYACVSCKLRRCHTDVIVMNIQFSVGLHCILLITTGQAQQDSAIKLASNVLYNLHMHSYVHFMYDFWRYLYLAFIQSNFFMSRQNARGKTHHKKLIYAPDRIFSCT